MRVLGWSLMLLIRTLGFRSVGRPAAPISRRRLGASAGVKEPDVKKCGQVRLRGGKSRLFRRGNPLVFGGAVANVTGECVLGGPVEVVDGAGRPVGWGVYNPESMYRVRLLGGCGGVETSEARIELALRRRIEDAVGLRRALNLPSEDTTAYRAVNAEGDGLSGLVVDVLGDCVVVAVSASWVQMRRELVTEILLEHFPEKRIIWRPAAARLKQDGWLLEDKQEEPLEKKLTVIRESGVEYEVDATDGQKTGFFCDQRENRAAMAAVCKGKKVLDLYCYSGGFSLGAAKNGGVTLGVDSSQAAVDLATSNAKRNGVDATFVKADVVSFLKSRNDEGEQFDVVICDPPKLAPTVKDLHRATAKYKKINTMAMKAVKRGGLLLSCTCSSAMTCSDNKFLEVLEEAAAEAGRKITILRTSGAAPDHTLNPAYKEGQYLTALLLLVL